MKDLRFKTLSGLDFCTCHFCSLSGHWKTACPTRLLCFIYRRPGHLARRCPNGVVQRVEAEVKQGLLDFGLTIGESGDA